MNVQPSLRARLHNKETLIGTVLTLPSPEIAELMSRIGYDWVFVDFEHSAMTTETLQRMLQAAGPVIPCAVRCPTHDEVWIKKCLDIGAHALIIPQVRTRDEVEKVARYAKYPPQGQRGVAAARAHAYGLHFQAYLDTANEDIALIIQIEHIEAVAAIEDILQVEAVDCFFVGPYDLSASMGKTGCVDDPEVVEAINSVRDACRAHDRPLGIFGATPEAVRPYREQGYQLIAAGTDISLLSDSAVHALHSLR
jgi:2-keto-3-deoxy-L-rhamnonate aldolase RhmA